MSYRLSSVMNSVKTLHIPMKYPIAFFIAIASCQAYATPAGFGTFTRDATPKAGSVVSGRYTTLTGAKGAYTISAGTSNGYNGRSFRVGNNGIEIKNEANTNIANDSFTYTFSITPDDNTAIHTIKIGQASYTRREGNSEVARHTLSYTPNSAITAPSRVYVKENASVPFYYEAMGDYFMGQRLNTQDFTYNNATEAPQLRANNANKLYFYRLDFLNGTNLGGNKFRPGTNNGNVSVRNNANGFLPPNPTFTNIIKSTSTNPNNQNTFSALAVDASTNNNQNVQYVSYGIANADSNYVVAVENASSVTLTYEGIMNGSNAISGETVGETFNEWISFGVESELANYVFSGTVFNDNGGIINPDADNTGTPYTNNTTYFNGIFDNNESGISDSTVSLASNCNSLTPNIIATQTITEADADAGAYNFTVPISTINTSSSICIIEDNNSNDYPIRTTSAKQPISFTDDKYLYEDINFGRVIAANKALVLEKEQAVNDCSITTLLPSAQNNLNYSKTELRDVDPGQCIAYRITATNRANLPITDFVMQDVLQKAGMKNATVTSVLANPERTSDDFNDGLNVGENGTVKTASSDLGAKSQRSFYFNTKYGSSQSNP